MNLLFLQPEYIFDIVNICILTVKYRSGDNEAELTRTRPLTCRYVSCESYQYRNVHVKCTMGLKKENICISLITETEFYPVTTGRLESFCADYIFKNPKITTRLID